MKVKSKTPTIDGTNRISALKRLSKPTTMNNNIHQRLSAPTTPIVTDARQLLTNRNKPVFDARQLLSRQSSKTNNNSLILQRDIEPTDEEEDDDDNQETVVLTRFNNGRLTSGTATRSFSTEPISFTKTIPNTSYDRPSQNAPTPSSSSDQKVVISFVNDQYRKRARSPSPPSPPPIIKRLNDASIQTTPASSTSRLAKRRDLDESPKKQHSLSATSKGPLKQTPTSTRPKPMPSSSSDAATILITNLQSSVTEDDVIELFSEIGHINEIKTLSRGCVQVIYSKEEEAEQAVSKYHNRLLDGQLMYVSLQQPTSYTTKSSKPTNESSKTKSNQISIDPSFIRQALFNPSTNTTNPVQFQVKL